MTGSTSSSHRSESSEFELDDEDRQEGGERPYEGLDGMDQEHPLVEPLPLSPLLGTRRARRAGRRFGHVASPFSATAAVVRLSTSCRATSRSSPSILQRSGGRRRRHRHARQTEQLGDGPTFEVNGLHPRERRDPALLVEPTGLRVDRVRSGLPTMHAVTPAGHGEDVGDRENEPGRRHHVVRRAVRCVVDEPPEHLRQTNDERHDDALDGPHADRSGRHEVRGLT